MIVDASALVAIVNQEPDARRYEDALGAADRPMVAAPTLLETRMALTRLGAVGQAALARVLDTYEIGVLPFDDSHAERAHQAHQLYGRGSGHRAKLNFGDCMAYAMASVERRPLLYKGDDFGHTDVRSALAT